MKTHIDKNNITTLLKFKAVSDDQLFFNPNSQDLPLDIFENINDKQYISTSFSHGNEKVYSKLLYPMSVNLNVHTEKAHRHSIQFAREFNLFNGNFNIVEKHKFAYLCGLAYHHLGEEELILTSDYITTLFDQDTAIDESGNEKNLFHLIKKSNDEIIGMIKGDSKQLKSYSERFKAFHNINERLVKYPFNNSYFITTLEDYLRAGQWESKVSGVPNLTTYINWRQYTGAAFNAFALGALLSGWDLPRLHRYAEIRKMEEIATNCIGISNDIYSFPKEYSFLNEQNTKVEKNNVLFNIVYILMEKESKNIHLAIEEAEKLHDREMESFYEFKEYIYESYFQYPYWEFEQMKSYISFLESWMVATPVYSKLSHRYNNEDVLLFDFL